ncbi:MAG: type II toxin-antitoxin system RelE/ParE family toxin [Candidatus Micrarchaeota archaeon]|nr:type II toxin-antitoxin system RelE/ParE family toxin [Candidatus Micrarchaeota archaeon]
MEIEQAREFEKDVKKVTAKTKQRIDDIAKLLASSTKLGDQLHHMKDVYSIRIENRRLVYQILEKEDKIILLLFKSREEVYEYLRGY